MAAGYRVRFRGTEELARDLRRSGRQFHPVMRKLMHVSGQTVERFAKESFSDGWRTLAKYTISGGKRKRRKPQLPVSAEPWKLARFSGDYRKRITYRVLGGKKRLRAIVGPMRTPYAAVHEFGTHGQKARPVMGPGLRKAIPTINALIDQMMVKLFP